MLQDSSAPPNLFHRKGPKGGVLKGAQGLQATPGTAGRMSNNGELARIGPRISAFCIEIRHDPRIWSQRIDI